MKPLSVGQFLIIDSRVWLQCTNNLKQIGLASHNFHDDYRVFQSENMASRPPYPFPGTCWNLQTLVYLEQQNAALRNRAQLTAVNNGQIQLPIYICPSRARQFPVETFHVRRLNPRRFFCEVGV